MHSRSFRRPHYMLASLAALLVCTAWRSHSQDAAEAAHSTPRRKSGPTYAVLPNGREIRPLGAWVPLAPYPFALAVRPDGEQVAIPSIGFPFALNLIDHPGSQTTSRRIPSFKEKDPQLATHDGLAYSPDGSTLYVATGDSGTIAVYNTADWTRQKDIPLNGPAGPRDPTYSGSFAGAITLSKSGRWLFVIDQGNWRVVVVDTERRASVASVPTGALPLSLALSPDEQHLYIANCGLFEYKRVGAPRNGETEGLRFPPFGFPSPQARKGVIVEGKRVPALGSENSLQGSSAWTYRLEQPDHPVLSAKLRLGRRITGKEVIGGAAPTGLAVDAGAVYVSLAHQDSMVKLSADGSRVLAETPLSPFGGTVFAGGHALPLRGVMPSGLALGAGRLYVAESGINAVAVLDTQTMRVLEHIPAGWNPSAVALSPDGSQLYVVNTKGKGTGPNAGKDHPADSPSYIGALEYGSLQIVPLPAPGSPQELTGAVLAANLAAMGAASPLPRLKHCFLIIRENRTFDEILGDLPDANGDPSLARYGMDGTAEENKAAVHLHVTPNLHALAAQYAASDNFHVDSEVSADGHRWIVGINPTYFFNTAWTSNYGGHRSSSPAAPQPGRRALFGGADAPMPEDEPQFGSLWEHVAHSGKGILNYGEGLELEGSDEDDGLLPEGQLLRLNAPLPRPVFESTDRQYPTFNLGIPDQLRADEFERNMRRRIARHAVPALIVVRLPNDHTAAPRPADGYPYRASYVADNDLALGRMIAFLSRTTLWKDSAVFITEDDAQGGVDHVDAHRSVLVIASPRLRAGTVLHQHISMGSITRTIDTLLGLGPLNLEDALAGEISGLFTQEPVQPAAFTLQPSDPRVFSPAGARAARPRTKAERAALQDMDDPAEIMPEVEASARARRAEK